MRAIKGDLMDTTTPEQSLDSGLTALEQLRADQKRLEVLTKEVQRSAVALMTKLGLTRRRTEDGMLEATLVEPQAWKLVPEKLREAVGPRVYESLTRPVLDEALVEAAVTRGELDPQVVAACSVARHPSPHIRVRRVS